MTHTGTQWSDVKERQERTRTEIVRQGVVRSERAHRPKHLFSGMLKCGCCGSGYTIVVKAHYGCTRIKGTCDNRITIPRDELEQRVLSGLKDQLLHPDLIADFVTAYHRESYRLSAEVTKDRTKAEQELAKVIRQIDKIIDAITEGMFHPSMKGKMDELEAQKSGLEEALAATEPEQPFQLHPGPSDVYQAKIANLPAALNDPTPKTEATTFIRSLLSKIRLTTVSTP